MKNRTSIILAIVLLAGFLSFFQGANLILAQATSTSVEQTQNLKEQKKAEPTAQSSNQELLLIIEQLKNQIKQLQTQIAELKSEVATVKEEVKITRQLYKGVSGDEVKEVQKFLKEFSEIYPEGLVTGYYGPLTEKAVKKFQEREGLEPTGKIDEITRNNINEYLAEGTAKKVVICHYPPENPSNKQTIEISSSALKAHLAHNDTIGICEQVAVPPVTTSPEITTSVPEAKPSPSVSLETESDIQKEVSSLQSKLSSISPDTTEYSAMLSKISALQDKLAKLKAAKALVNSPIVQIAGTDSNKNLCVLTKDGLVYCQNQSAWTKKGISNNGSFTLAPGLTDAASIVVGQRSACAVKKDGSCFCWGSNGYGQLGDGTFVDKAEPVQVFGLGPGTTVSVSLGNTHACALKTDGSVVCWGSNDSSLDGGQIGDGTLEVVRPKPTQVISLGPGSTSAIFSNNVGNCAIKADDSIVCWGSVHANGYSGATKPVKISQNLGKVKYLMLGFKVTCAIKADSSVVCWGQNYCGQLGNGRKTSVSPTQVVGLGPGSTIALSSESGYWSSALKTDGSVVTWGCAAPGDGTIFNKYAPVQVSELTAGTTSSIANSTACAIKTDGSVVCWSEGAPAYVAGLK